MARVLIVDDVPSLGRVAAAVLQAAGHEAVTAGGGRDALKVISDDPPDVVVPDVSMPEVDGFAVMKVLQKRALEGAGPPPVVVLSALDDEESRSRAAELGAARYLVKGRAPIETLLDAVSRLSATQGCRSHTEF